MEERPGAGERGGRSRSLEERPVVLLKRTPKVVRAWPPVDGLIYNIMSMNVVVVFNFPLLIAMTFYPGGNLPLAILITACFCLAQAVVYAFLASTMPRSGGDYVFQSRLLSGSFGTMYAFTAVVLGGAMWMAIGGWFAADVVVAPLLILFGYHADLPFLVRWGELALSPHGVFFFALVATAWAGLVNIWGLRTYARLQRLCFGVGGVALVFVLVALVTSDQAGFIASFNGLLSGPLGLADPYQTTITRAAELGFDPDRGAGVLGPTLALLPIVAFALIYPAWSVQQAGEIKRAHELRAQVFMIVGAEVVTALLTATVVGLGVSRVGREFLGSAAYLWSYHREALPLPVGPFFGFFLSFVGPSGVLALITVAILYNAWFWMWAPDITLGASRVLLAMSSDRLLPDWVGHIGPRSKAPVKAIAFFSGMCVVAASLYSYTDFWRLTLDAAVLNVLAFGVTCGAGAAFPFTKRELYRESTAAQYEIFGIPVITLAGSLFLAFTGFVIWRFLVDDALALGVSVPISLLYVMFLYLCSLVLYLGFRRYRRTREGLDIEVVYRDIPVE